MLIFLLIRSRFGVFNLLKSSFWCFIVGKEEELKTWEEKTSEDQPKFKATNQYISTLDISPYLKTALRRENYDFKDTLKIFHAEFSYNIYEHGQFFHL